jgi:hypothetical protein
MASPLRQADRGYPKSARIEDRVEVALSSVARDGETIYRARGRGFQGLAVVAPSEAQAKTEAKEILAALRLARGQRNPYRVIFVTS